MVIQTNLWLNRFITQCQNRRLKNLYEIQRETLCLPIKEDFPDIHEEELQFHLLQHGLFDPKEWRHVDETIQQMEQLNVWKTVEQEYQRLKKKWKGPNVPIYIFPVTNAQAHKKNHLSDKGGLAFKGAVFLFLSPTLSTQELKALFAHEYNHVCRLTHMNLYNEAITLKEILILEGLAEYAVKELYGSQYLAAWINLYSNEEILDLWINQFVPELDLVDKSKLDIYVYGVGNRHFPKWIGYNIGYQIIESYQELNGPITSYELLLKPTDEIINGSKFKY